MPFVKRGDVRIGGGKSTQPVVPKALQDLRVHPLALNPLSPYNRRPQTNNQPNNVTNGANRLARKAGLSSYSATGPNRQRKSNMQQNARSSSPTQWQTNYGTMRREGSGYAVYDNKPARLCTDSIGRVVPCPDLYTEALTRANETTRPWNLPPQPKPTQPNPAQPKPAQPNLPRRGDVKFW